MAKSSLMNRGYSGGLAAGSRPGGGFGSSFQSSFQAQRPAAPAAQPPSVAQGYGGQAPSVAQGYGGQAPSAPQAPAPYSPPAAPAAPDAFAPWNQQPLPQLGQQTFNQQPASPFGPAPLPSAAQGYGGQAPFGGFRANGGPVQPGQAYVVGEEGPEVIVPQQPGMVVPNQSALRQSPMNPSQDRNKWADKYIAANDTPNYAQYPEAQIIPGQNDANSQWSILQSQQFGENSLANRKARPMGRSANDIQRIAEQQRRRGNPRLLIALGMQQRNQQFSAQQDAQRMQQMQARDIQHRGWQQQDYQTQQQTMDKREQDRRAWEANQALTMHGINTGEKAMELERQRLQAEEDRKRVPNIQMVPLPGTNYVMPSADGRPMGTLPLNTPAPPPSIQMTPVAPGGNQFVPMTPDGNAVPGQPTYTGEQVPGSYVRRDTEGKPVPMQYTPNTPPAAAPKMQWEKDADGKIVSGIEQRWNPQTSKWEFHRVPIIDANNDGIPDAAQPGGGAAPAGKGGYFDTLLPPAAGAAKPQAAAEPMATGQMPNVAYANPINPEQQLASARDEYARTGNDAAIRAYFKENPSVSVQKYQQASALLTQLGEQIAATDQTAQQRQQQHLDRDAYINANAGSPLGQGYAAEEYDQNFPDRVNRLAGPHNKADYKLLEDAMRLAREADIAAGRNSPALSPANVPLPPVLPRSQADRNPQGLAAKLARMPVGRLPVMPVRLRSAS